MMTAATATKRAFYEQISADFGIHHLPGLDEVLPADPAAALAILEIGCGAGHIAGGVKRRYPNSRMLAADISQRCLAVTNDNYPAVETITIDADGQFPLPAASVDLAYSANLFEHLQDGPGHLREMHRILKPGGAYLISTPHILFDTVWWGLIRPKNEGRWRMTIGRLRRDPALAHCNLQTPRSLRWRAAAAGFRARNVRRGAFSDLERDKLISLFGFLPACCRRWTAGGVARLWGAIPPWAQPTIVVIAEKAGQ